MEQKTRFRKLIESAQIGRMAVKNRMIMAPMGTALSTGLGLVTDEMVSYYETRAKGGAGLIVVENACIDFPRGKQRSHALSIDGEETIPGLSRLAQAIKKHGARAAIQLHHSGRVARSGITGFQPVGPSPVASVGGELPQELTITVEADTLVFATGGTSNDQLYHSLEGVIPKLFRAGDCVQPRGIMEAIDEGMQIGLRIS